jgi:HAD superfamily hydrolase (TIGR01450 family)
MYGYHIFYIMQIKKQHTALILAAGSGTRIANKYKIPKCMLLVKNKKILDYQLESFKYAGVNNIFIVTGYKSTLIKKNLKKYKKSLNIIVIENKIFDKSNNMYSAYLAKKFLKDKNLIICNGDVVVDKKVVKNLINGKKDNEIAVDNKIYNDESMKVSVRYDNKIVDISKKIFKDKSDGCSIDFYKMSSNTSASFFEYIEKHIKKFGKKDWTEVALKKILNKNKFYPNYLNSLKWHEIDNYEDLIHANNKFSNLKDKILKKYDNFILDIDGTTFKKHSPINGTELFLKNLKRLKKKIIFLSNNSSMSFMDFKKIFLKVNFNLKKSNMIISSDVLIKYLKLNKIKSVYPLANQKFIQNLKKHKIKINSINPEFIVVTYDDELSYKKLQLTCELINNGIKILSTHDDMFYPSKYGPIPDAGSILSLIEKTTNKIPLKIFGKPSSEIKKLIKLKGKTIVIGDRITKDIQFAKNCNYDSALVLSGAENTNKFNLKKNAHPNYILASIADLN